MDDLNQLEKQMQPKIMADRTRDNVASSAAWSGTILGAGAIVVACEVDWVIGAILGTLAFICFVVVFIAASQGDQYEE